MPAVLLLEAFVAAPMLPAAVRIARPRLIVPICLAACVGVPLGVAMPMPFQRMVVLLASCWRPKR